MQIDGLEVMAPGLIPQPWSQAHAFGCATWLWMHSGEHQQAPLHALPTLLLPPLLSRQFIIALQADRPVFYMAWAMLSAEAEGRYLRNPPILMPHADWTGGDRMWITDWVAPFGHTRAISRLIWRHLLPRSCARALKHHGGADDGRNPVISFRGSQVSRSDADRWWQAHPLPPGAPPQKAF